MSNLPIINSDSVKSGTADAPRRVEYSSVFSILDHMKTQPLCFALAIMLFAADSTFTTGQDSKLPDLKLSDFKIGSVVSRPVVDLKNTGGKGVVIDAWGVNRGPCIALLPEMEKLASRNSKDTIFIGAECQGSETEAIMKLVTKNRLSYTITKSGVEGPVEWSSLPYSFVFDPSGNLIYHGRPTGKDFEKAVRRAGKQ